MIVDGFLFNDELDMLELRLMELGDLVDRFVVVESHLTFQQKEKPLHFAENTGRFARWIGKIQHVVASPENSPHPVIEHESRRFIYEGFRDLDIGDVIMIGDVDEIPSRKVVESLRRNAPRQALVCKQHLYYYRVTNHAGWWNGTVAMARGVGKIDCQRIRDDRHFMPPFPAEPAGWHFSWFGDAEDVARKLGCIDVKSDDALYRSNLLDIPEPEETEKIARRVAIGDDLFGRDRSFTSMPIVPGCSAPNVVNEWLKGREKYA